MIRFTRSLLPALAIVALAACSATAQPQAPVEPVPEISQPTAVEGGGAVEDSGSEANVVDQGTDPSPPEPAPGSDADAGQKYFEAIVSNDPETMADALKYAAPKSVAEAYARHQVNSQQAELDGGSANDPDTLNPAGENGIYGYCYDVTDTSDKDCNIWQNVRFNQGKVVDFTVQKQNISKRITLGSGDKVKAGTLADVTFLSAYQSVTGKALSVVVNVKSHGKKISLTSAYSATYRDPSGRQGEATDAEGPSDLDKDSNGNVSMIFKGAKPGGVLSLELSDSDFNSTRVVKIKTA